MAIQEVHESHASLFSCKKRGMWSWRWEVRWREEKIKIDEIQIFNMWVSALKIKVSGEKKPGE